MTAHVTWIIDHRYVVRHMDRQRIDYLAVLRALRRVSPVRVQLFNGLSHEGERVGSPAQHTFYEFLEKHGVEVRVLGSRNDRHQGVDQAIASAMSEVPGHVVVTTHERRLAPALLRVRDRGHEAVVLATRGDWRQLRVSRALREAASHVFYFEDYRVLRSSWDLREAIYADDLWTTDNQTHAGHRHRSSPLI